MEYDEVWPGGVLEAATRACSKIPDLGKVGGYTDAAVVGGGAVASGAGDGGE